MICFSVCARGPNFQRHPLLFLNRKTEKLKAFGRSSPRRKQAAQAPPGIKPPESSQRAPAASGARVLSGCTQAGSFLVAWEGSQLLVDSTFFSKRPSRGVLCVFVHTTKAVGVIYLAGGASCMPMCWKPVFRFVGFSVFCVPPRRGRVF